MGKNKLFFVIAIFDLFYFQIKGWLSGAPLVSMVADKI